MVKPLVRGLLAAVVIAVMMCGIVVAGSNSSSPSSASAAGRGLRRRDAPGPSTPLEEDPAARNERSTNLSVAGASRKIQMFIKNRHLQILSDGTVNGTTDYTSVYTILQRSTIGVGQMKIQGVATCQYLCMDSCGMLYGAREFGDDCIFNETIEQHHYNTYLSSKYSNANRTMYLALNRMGQPKRVQLKANQQLGKKSSYTRVLTRTVDSEQIDNLYHVRHHAHLCTEKTETASSHQKVEQPRCHHKRRKRKKKRKCVHESGTVEADADHGPGDLHMKSANVSAKPVRKCHVDDSERECELDRDVNHQREQHQVPVTFIKAKPNKDSIDKVLSTTKRKRMKKKKRKNKNCIITREVSSKHQPHLQEDEEDAMEATEVTVVAATVDEDYYTESSTPTEWEPDPTALQEADGDTDAALTDD